MKRMLYIVYNLQCFFLLLKQLCIVYIYILHSKKYTNFINSSKEENIRLIKVIFKKREFIPKNIIISS